MDVNRSNLTVSQAEGLSPIPVQFRKEELPAKFRSASWMILHDRMTRRLDYGGILDPWAEIYKYFMVLCMNIPSDEISYHHVDVSEQLKNIIFNGSYNEVLDLFQFILRRPGCPSEFAQEIDACLDVSKAGWMLIRNPPTFVPKISDEQERGVKAALEIVSGSEFWGARRHLMQSAEELSSANFVASVRESIHAVEAVARTLEPSAATLAPALKKLTGSISIHPALAGAFEKIYGYTSDENGIRHAYIDEENQVDEDIAMYMFTSCAAFVAYVVRKSERANLI